MVDAHSYVRLMLVELIERAEGLAVVGSSGSAQRAFADIVRLHPHVAVLDGALGDLRHRISAVICTWRRLPLLR